AEDGIRAKLVTGVQTCALPIFSWLYLVATENLELRAVRSQLRFFATGIVILAAISILFYWTHLNLPFWLSRRGFGPFPNRNQTRSEERRVGKESKCRSVACASK